MKNKEIDKHRFRYLINVGIPSGQLKKFFKENHKILILAGARVQNLPADSDAAIDLLFRMPEKAFKVFAGWFRKNLAITDPIPVDDILKEYAVLEKFSDNAMEKLERDHEVRLASSTLTHWLGDDYSSELNEFLASPIKPKNGGPLDKAKKTQNLAQEQSQEKRIDLLMAEACIRDLSDEELIEVLGPLNSFIRGVRYLRGGNFTAVEDVLAELENCENVELRAILEKALNSEKMKDLHDQAQSMGLNFVPAHLISNIDELSEIEVEDAEIVGRCSNHNQQGGASYIDVIGIWKNESLITFTDDVLAKLFPTVGQVIAFGQGVGSVRLPTKDEFGVWKAEKYPTEKNIKCRVRQATRTVYEIFDVPFRAEQYDSVRDFLRQHKSLNENKPLFLLADGLVIAPRREVRDFRQFDEPLNAWTSLSAIHHKTRKLVIGPLPAADLSYDCSEADKLLKTLLKTEQQLDSMPKLSKADIQAFREAFSQNKSNIDSLRLVQLQTEFNELFENAERIKDTFNVLLEHPKIKSELERAKKTAEEQMVAQKSSLQADIIRLQGEKSSIEKAIKTRQAEQSKLPSQVSKAIKTAFHSAKEDGIKTLSEVAIYKAVFDEVSPSHNEHPASRSFANEAHFFSKLHTSDLEPLPKQLHEVFTNLGINKSIANSLAIATQLVVDSGLILALTGFGSALAAKNIACALSKAKVRIIEIPIGLIQGLEVQFAMRRDDAWDALVLQNFNFSSIEAYGSDLLISVMDQISSAKEKPTKFVIASASNGIGALPISTTFSKIAIHINLELDEYPDFEDDLETFKNRLEEDLSDKEKASKPWKIALNRLLSEASRLSDEDQKSVLPVIYCSLTSEFNKSSNFEW